MKPKSLPVLIWLLFGYATLAVFFGGEAYAQRITRPVCGDGQRTWFEQCDDGNTVTEACPYGVKKCKVCGADCRRSLGIYLFCGDGTINGPEECDDGPTNSDIEPNACRTNCRRPVCGDGVQDSGEECDDGNIVTEACPYGERECTVCSAICKNVAGTTSFCGDGTRNGTEECDDGNIVTEACLYGQRECTVCGATCQNVAGAVSYCGDGIRNGAEECDDGNTREADGCTQSCRVSSCESFTPEAPEFFVNNTENAVDTAPGDGECRTATGVCSLRAAVMESNALEGDSVIWIDGDHTLRARFELRDDVVLCGRGSDPRDNIIRGSVPIEVNLIVTRAKIENLTLRTSLLSSLNQLTLSRIIVEGSPLSENPALFFHGGNINIVSSTFKNNDSNVIFFDSWASDVGNRLSISDSSFLDNRNRSGRGIVHFSCSYSSGTFVISNTTFSRNETPHGASVHLEQDSFNPYNCTLDLESVTITQNIATNYGAGVHFDGNQDNPPLVTVRNSIIGRNWRDVGGSRQEDNCSHFGPIQIVHVENSLIGPTSLHSCSGYTPVPGDFNYGLGELIDSDLPGQSHVPLLEGSPAINAGNPATCPATDQLGHPRVGPCDIGAVEYRPAGD